MNIHTYLTFNGNCREAFEFYQSVFGGEFHVLTTFADAPNDVDVPPEMKNTVMHVSLPIGDGVLMGSDPGDPELPFNMGNNFSLSLSTDSVKQTDELLEKLSEGGEVTVPAENTFWGAYFAMCTDRFGISWMLMHELAEASIPHGTT